MRKEKGHLSKFKARVKDLQAQGLETEALLSAIKEDKVIMWIRFGDGAHDDDRRKVTQLLIQHRVHSMYWKGWK